MGRKYKHLYEQLYDFENLWMASRKARRGRRQKPATGMFEYNLEQELFEIQELLRTETYRFSPYDTFMIYDPKKRLIHAAPYRDRVVHHAIINLLEPILDRILIYDTYACRSGKGSHKAIDRAHSFLRSSAWVLKLDIKKYFFTIDHQILLTDLAKKISDSCMMTLIEKLLATYSSAQEYYFPMPGDDIFSVTRPRGLPIGNLTSQWFANFFLNPVDRFIKENLHVKKYVRYMDDLLIFNESKKHLNELKKSIAHFLQNRRLLLHPQKSQIFPARQGVKFLGFHLYQTHRRILRDNLKRFKKRMRLRSKQYLMGQIDKNTLLLSLNGWLGYAGKEQHRKHRKFINGILSTLQFKETEPSNVKFTFFIP